MKIISRKIKVLIVTFALISGCSQEPQILMFNLKSYSSVSELSINDEESTVWHVIEHIEDEREGHAYDLKRMETEGAISLGLSGRTVLTFFNDRLLEVRFYSNNEISLDHLISLDGRKGVNCWKAVNVSDDTFYACEDKTLYDEHNDWITKYS